MKKQGLLLMSSCLIVILTTLMSSMVFAWRPEDMIPDRRRPTESSRKPVPEPRRQIPELPYSLSIDYFRTTSDGDIALGDEETLRWRIAGRNVRDIRVEITPAVGSVTPGARTELSGGAFRIEGTRNIRPSETTTYTLRVRGTGIFGDGATTPVEKTATVGIRVRRPRLENVQPEVNQRDAKIKFFATNTGEADFLPTPISVYYQIQGKGGIAAPAVLRQGTFTSPRRGIGIRERVEIGEITLPNRQQALSYDELQVIVEIEASYVFPLAGDKDTYIHRWTPNTIRINETLIDIFGAMVRGSIRLNNYNGAGCCTTRSNPYRPNDSYVEIMDFRRTFSPPRFEFTKGFYDYRGFINDLNAPNIRGSDLFSIQDGKIKLTIRFETGGGEEIRGWEETWGVWHDLTAPDVDIQQLDVSVSFVPGARAGRITYTGVEVSSVVRVTFVGLYRLSSGVGAVFGSNWETYIENQIKNRIRSEISSILMINDIRQRIEDGIDERIRSLPITPPITRIISVSGEGGTINISYL